MFVDNPERHFYGIFDSGGSHHALLKLEELRVRKKGPCEHNGPCRLIKTAKTHQNKREEKRVVCETQSMSAGSSSHGNALERKIIRRREQRTDEREMQPWRSSEHQMSLSHSINRILNRLCGRKNNKFRWMSMIRSSIAANQRILLFVLFKKTFFKS